MDPTDALVVCGAPEGNKINYYDLVEGSLEHRVTFFEGSLAELDGEGGHGIGRSGGYNYSTAEAIMSKDMVTDLEFKDETMMVAACQSGAVRVFERYREG